MPILVEGDSAEWCRAAGGLRAAHASLGAAGCATIAIVDGHLGGELVGLLEPFDLVASGDSAEANVRGWLDGFAANPQSATVLAHTLRGEPSLFTESLAFSALQSGPEHARWLAARSAPNRSAPGARMSYEERDGVHVVTLARPDRHNALDIQMREELCDILDALPRTARTPILLTGAGPSFCSGGDLQEFGLRLDPVHAHLVRSGRSIAARLQELSSRVVAAVHGACIGAGLELASFSVRVIAASDAIFRLPEVGFGLIPGSGGTVSVRRRAGRHAFFDLALTGRQIDAEEALHLGIVDEICDPQILHITATRAAQRLGR
jgi:enoyl-CoA hydratase/carnithine racemase